MKITKNTLKRMIKEELGRVLKEGTSASEQVHIKRYQQWIPKLAQGIEQYSERALSPAEIQREWSRDSSTAGIFDYLKDRQPDLITNIEEQYLPALEKLKGYLEQYSDPEGLQKTAIKQLLSYIDMFPSAKRPEGSATQGY